MGFKWDLGVCFYTLRICLLWELNFISGTVSDNKEVSPLKMKLFTNIKDKDTALGWLWALNRQMTHCALTLACDLVILGSSATAVV